MSAHALPSPFDGKEIWFLTGSQDLYGEETLARVAEQSRQVAAWLDEAEAVPVPIVWKPVLKDRDAIRAAMLAANADDACIGVIAWMHTFSPAKMWIAGIDALAEPLLQLHTQYSESLPWSTIDMDYMNLNQAAHGDREFGYLLTRLGQPRKVVVGHATHAATRAKVGVWARAAAGWDALHRTRLVRFGDNMRNVAVTEGDKTEAELRLGASVNTWGVNDLVAVVDAVGTGEIDALVAETDPGALRRIVANLVRNAVQHGRGRLRGALGRTVRLRTCGGVPVDGVLTRAEDGFVLVEEGDGLQALVPTGSLAFLSPLPGPSPEPDRHRRPTFQAAARELARTGARVRAGPTAARPTALPTSVVGEMSHEIADHATGHMLRGAARLGHDGLHQAGVAVAGVGVGRHPLGEALGVELRVELGAVHRGAHPDHLDGAVGRRGQQGRVGRHLADALMVADQRRERLRQVGQERVRPPVRGHEDLRGAELLAELPGGGGAEIAGQDLQSEARGEHRHALLERHRQQLAHLLLDVHLGTGLGALRRGDVVGASPDEDAGDVTGREGVEEIDLLQEHVVKILTGQTALGQEGLVLILRRLELGARRHHDEGLHPVSLGGTGVTSQKHLKNRVRTRARFGARVP